MTYKTKNATIVLAFASLLLVMPMASSNAFGDTIITNVSESCGFSISPAASFGAITRGSSVTEQSVVFTPTGGSTGIGVISVTATDWIGDGARASGSVTLVNVATTETIVINGVTYTAGASESTPTFTFGGTDIEDAASLARVINAGSDTANVRAYTSGTNTVTIEAETRGSAGNSITIVENVADAGTTVSGATMSGGGASPVSHIPAETTKFNMVDDGGSSTGVSYASKTKSMPESGATPAQEMLGGIDTTKVVNLSLEFSTEFLTAATGTATFASVTAGDTVTLNGITYTAISGTTSGTNFSIDGASDTLDAQELRDVINSNDGTNLTATEGGDGVVTITYDTSGLVGNIVGLTETGTTITVSGSGTLAGGTEYMENLPYDGALTQTLTFTLACI